ncbi:MAG: hypothetical protein K2X48_11355 [Chitinophagaceae bacterium]|nr:hypothetical protein [Chitinophagaceae bacterium]
MPAANIELQLPSFPQILYLTLEAKRDTVQGTTTATIIQQQVSNGQLKEATVLKKDKLDGVSWEVHLLDAKKKTVSAVRFTDPLVQVHEYTNDKGEFIKTTIKLTRVEIPLRMSCNNSVKNIQVKEISDSNKEKLILFSNLNL